MLRRRASFLEAFPTSRKGSTGSRHLATEPLEVMDPCLGERQGLVGARPTVSSKLANEPRVEVDLKEAPARTLVQLAQYSGEVAIGTDHDAHIVTFDRVEPQIRDTNAASFSTQSAIFIGICRAAWFSA